MKLLKIRNMAMMGVMGVAGLGLIGAGAHAVFTTNTASSQTINAGTLGVVESSPDAPGCTTVADGCTSLTLTAAGPEGSTFDTTPDLITLTNTGGLPAYYSTVTYSETNNNSTFASETSVCDFSNPAGPDAYGHFYGVDDQGLVTTVATGSPVSISGSGAEYVIQPGQTDNFSLDFYAGEASSVCGGTAPASLTTDAEGGSLTFTISYAYTD
jgi:hypothetical protein